MIRIKESVTLSVLIVFTIILVGCSQNNQISESVVISDSKSIQPESDLESTKKIEDVSTEGFNSIETELKIPDDFFLVSDELATLLLADDKIPPYQRTPKVVVYDEENGVYHSLYSGTEMTDNLLYISSDDKANIFDEKNTMIINNQEAGLKIELNHRFGISFEKNGQIVELNLHSEIEQLNPQIDEEELTNMSVYNGINAYQTSDALYLMATGRSIQDYCSSYLFKFDLATLSMTDYAINNSMGIIDIEIYGDYIYILFDPVEFHDKCELKIYSLTDLSVVYASKTLSVPKTGGNFYIDDNKVYLYTYLDCENEIIAAKEICEAL